MRVYTLFDRKVGEYGSLVLGPTDESVIRALRQSLPPNSTEARYPEDFELVYLGEFDQVSGALQGLVHPKPLGTLASILGIPPVETSHG